MFDIFATILSAGVVISVVTLVVHEPLLLAAGISTILGLMFVLLPAFVAMVPMLGYLLMFTGAVLLGYGVLSTRSWLNALEAKRVAALARRRTLAAARSKPGDDSELRLASRLTNLAALGGSGGSNRAKPTKREDDESRADLTPVRSPSIPDGEAPHGRRTNGDDGITGSALGRLGRNLTRNGTGQAPSPARDDLVRAATRPTRPSTRLDDFDLTPEPDNRLGHRAEPLLPSLPPPLSTKTPTPAPTSPVIPVAMLQPVLPAPAKPASKAAPKPKSRGAERIEQIKAESRQAKPTRHRNAARPNGEERLDGIPRPVPLPTAPSTGNGAATVPKLAVATASDERRTQRQRDLAELGLPDPDTTLIAEPHVEKAGAKPFVARLARRS